MNIHFNRLARVGLVVGTSALMSAAGLFIQGTLITPWSIGAARAGPDHDHEAPENPSQGGKPAASSTSGDEASHQHMDGRGGADEGLIRMTPEQIATNHIGLTNASPGILALTLSAPGVIVPDSDRIARIAANVVGTVAVLNKRLGDRVEQGEIVAELDSREAAEARSDYFAATTNLELQKTLFAREEELWSRRVSAEQQFLRARNTLSEVQLRVELAAQKLAALGLAPKDVAASRKNGAAVSEAIQRYPLRSPIGGRVVERRVDRGAPVGGEGHEKELYVIADLSKLWADLAVPGDELSRIAEQQQVRLLMQDGTVGKGRIIFISPMLNPETRSARVIAEVDNHALRWRPGAYVTAQVITAEEPVALRIPREAIQSINNSPAVFVRTDEGFRMRAVTLGRDDGLNVAVTSGLAAGETVASSNAFLLKAELGKDEASHAH